MALAEQEIPIAAPRDVASIRRQLHTLVTHEALRTSRRSVAFLRYIVEETLAGHADDLKERTIGIHVFGKPLTYDTNLDHVVRTAASELRKRLAVYYAIEAHQDELRIVLVPGSYVPVFRAAPPSAAEQLQEPETIAAVDPVPVPLPERAEEILKAASPGPLEKARKRWTSAAILCVVILLCFTGIVFWMRGRSTPQLTFWAPLLKADGPVLIAVGAVPKGPPVADSSAGLVLPQSPHSPAPTLPYADAIAMTRIASFFSREGKEVILRREQSSTFADLRDRPVVLIGAFNNQWGLTLTRNLHFSLALDSTERLVYIRDRDHPEARNWSWSIDPHPGERERSGAAPLYDYALISRVLNSETGHEVMMLGGLSTYGTQAAGEFVTSPQLLSLAQSIPLDGSHHAVQIVLRTQVTEGTPGPPVIMAYHVD